MWLGYLRRARPSYKLWQLTRFKREAQALAEANDDLAHRLYSVLLGHNPCVHGGWDFARAIPGQRPAGREADADDLAG